jgi:hypothetical protein
MSPWFGCLGKPCSHCNPHSPISPNYFNIKLSNLCEHFNVEKNVVRCAKDINYFYTKEEWGWLIMKT